MDCMEVLLLEQKWRLVIEDEGFSYVQFKSEFFFRFITPALSSRETALTIKETESTRVPFGNPRCNSEEEKNRDVLYSGSNTDAVPEERGIVKLTLVPGMDPAAGKRVPIP